MPLKNEIDRLIKEYNNTVLLKSTQIYLSTTEVDAYICRGCMHLEVAHEEYYDNYWCNNTKVIDQKPTNVGKSCKYRCRKQSLIEQLLKTFKRRH